MTAALAARTSIDRLNPIPADAPPAGDGGLGAVVRGAFVALRRHALLASMVALAAFAAVVAYSLMVTPVYQTSALISIDEKRSSLPDVYESITLQENVVATEMELLQSRELAGQVVDTLGLRLQLTSPRRVSRVAIVEAVRADPNGTPGAYHLVRVAADRFRVDTQTGATIGWASVGTRVQLPGLSFVLADSAGRYSQIGLRVESRERTVEQLQRAIQVDRPARDANTISVTYRSTDPMEMPIVLNCLVRRYIAGRQDVQKAQVRSAVRFLQTQLDTLARQLAAADDSVLRFRERANVIRLDQEASSEVSRLVSMQADRSNLDAERASLAALLHAADSSRSGPLGSATSYRQLIASPSIFKNAVAAELLQSLTTLEDQRAALLTRRTTRDPEVAALSTRIEAIDDQVHTLAATYLDGLNTQIGSIDQTLHRFDTALRAVPAKDLEYARLQRSTTVLSDAFALLQTRLKEAQIAQAVEDPSVRVVDAAVVPDVPLRPRLVLNLAAGAVIAWLLAIASALLREHADRSVRTRADVTAFARLPVLGFIPSSPHRSSPVRRRTLLRRARATVARGSADHGAKAGVHEQVIRADSYSRLFAQLSQFGMRPGSTTLLVTSPLAGDGKTTNALNLALTVAGYGQRVLLIDADLRHRGLTRSLGFRRVAGLSEAILGGGLLEGLVHRVSYYEPRCVDVIPAGLAPIDSYSAFGTSGFRALLEDVTQSYDVVVIDTPPLIVSDAVLLSQYADGVLLVVRAGTTARNALEYAAEQLHAVNAPTLGVVLNDMDLRRDRQYDDAFAYYGSASAYVAS